VVAGLTGNRTVLVTTRPFRAPSQTISDVGLIAGHLVKDIAGSPRSNLALPSESLVMWGIFLQTDARPEQV
jgi:hypothetical protein